MRGRFAHRLSSGWASAKVCLSRVFWYYGSKRARPARVFLAGSLALVLALPRGAWAQQEEGWPFDPQERYDAAHNAFEVQEYRLAIELWMDVLSHPKCSELGGEMVRVIGQNLVSALSASFKRVAGAGHSRSSVGYSKIHEDAMRFCSLYEYFQEGETYSETVEDACIKWSEEKDMGGQAEPLDGAGAAESGPRAAKQDPAASQAKPLQARPAEPPLAFSRGRPPQLKAGIGMLVSAGVAGAFSVVGMIAEGGAMRDYHTSIHNNETDSSLRERADAWRTASVVSGGVGLALVTVGIVLSLAGTRSSKTAFAYRQKKRTAWRVRPRALELHF